MTTLNKSDLISSKEAGKSYYFFIFENHLAVIFLDQFTIEDLENVCVKNAKFYAEMDEEEIC